MAEDNISNDIDMEGIDERYTITQIAEKLGIKETTIRKYESDYDLAIPRNELGHRYYTDKELKVLRQIKQLKENGANIHMIKKLLERSVDAMEQKEHALDLVHVDKMTAGEFRDMILKSLVSMILEREEVLKDNFKNQVETLAEELKAEIRVEFQKQQEQMRGENQRLIDYLDNKRNRPGFLKRLLGK